MMGRWSYACYVIRVIEINMLYLKIFARLKDGLNTWFLQYVLPFCIKTLAYIEILDLLRKR